MCLLKSCVRLPLLINWFSGVYHKWSLQSIGYKRWILNTLSQINSSYGKKYSNDKLFICYE